VVKLALAQISPTLGNVEKNLALHESAAREASESGADLILYPELSLTGYRLGDMVPRRALRLDRPSPVLDRLLRASESIDLLVGLVEESEDIRFYNAAVYLSGGAILAVHRKCYLPTYGMFEEGRDLAAGEAFRAFDTRHGRLGILICEDLWHPTSAGILAQDGAEALLVCSAGPTRGLSAGGGLSTVETWEELARVTARFHTVYVAYCNRVGFEDEWNFGGGSFVMDPTGKPVASAPELEPAVTLAELSRDRLRRARASYPLLRDERLDLVLRELERIRRRRVGWSEESEDEP
jgi:predicted amidohydrolase